MCVCVRVCAEPPLWSHLTVLGSTCGVVNALSTTQSLINHDHMETLTLHQQPEDVTVLVRELVEQEVSPVLTEKIKWHQNVLLGFQAPGSECRVNRPQEPGAVGQRGLRAV